VVNIDYLVIAGRASRSPTIRWNVDDLSGRASRDPYEIVRVETILFGLVGDGLARPAKASFEPVQTAI